eukprot:CAMPEP_0170455746 /NCGR_PEP_ID=MMETSP0123-20130129/3604_1 /TAXON_ID=182087 /ORGANISM="Favella ehrenbergii, Strain Fehren 1" /LENGTH=128 /DNA_ID=CAMNT_0010718979 /DNA_START=1844 /DNA_END=2230 /DNA_ORIENTATION=-
MYKVSTLPSTSTFRDGNVEVELPEVVVEDEDPPVVVDPPVVEVPPPVVVDPPVVYVPPDVELPPDAESSPVADPPPVVEPSLTAVRSYLSTEKSVVSRQRQAAAGSFLSLLSGQVNLHVVHSLKSEQY